MDALESNRHPSDFLTEYQEHFSQFQSQDGPSLIKKLAEHGIILTKDYSGKLTKSINWQKGNSVNIQVEHGYYVIRVNLLKVYKDSKEMRRRTVHSGAYSKVYFLRMNGNEYAIKSQVIKEKDRATLNH